MPRIKKIEKKLANAEKVLSPQLAPQLAREMQKLAKTPYDIIQGLVPGLDLFQPRDWPHRSGDRIQIDLHSFPLTESSPGWRSHPCDMCGRACTDIHDTVLCWNCKGGFCLRCYASSDGVVKVKPLEKVIKKGFAACKVCKEPLRSIGLISSLRCAMEAVTHENIHGDGLNTHWSLKDEGEYAAARARKYTRRDETETAIAEYTHAINAVNYLASTTSGQGLVLSARDLLLLCHLQRAQLEGDHVLAASIMKAFPKASVRNPKTDEQSFQLSKAAFQSLFYPLPCKWLAGSVDASLLVMDLREDDMAIAIQRPFMREQLVLLGRTVSDSAIMEASLWAASMPDEIHSRDETFLSLNGIWKGAYTCQCTKQQSAASLVFGEASVAFYLMYQLVYVFPTAREAVDFQRNFLSEWKGETNNSLAVAVQNRLKELGSQAARHIKVIREKSPIPSEMRHLSSGNHKSPFMFVGGNILVTTAGNVAASIHFTLDSYDKYKNSELAEVMAKMLVYLEEQLLSNRSLAGLPPKETGCYHHPDLTMCAYCGKGGPTVELYACVKCKLAKYCGRDCQKKHFVMKGPFGHQPFCQTVAAAAPQN